MCSPAVVPIASIAISAAMAGVQAKMQADAAQKAATANAELAERQRGYALQRGASQASRIGAEVRRAQSTALTIAGGSGADTTAGTMGNMQTMSALAGAADIEQVRANAAMQAWGFEAEESDWFRRREIAGQEGMLGIAGATLGAIGSGASALTKR